MYRYVYIYSTYIYIYVYIYIFFVTIISYIEITCAAHGAFSWAADTSHGSKMFQGSWAK